VVGKAVAVALLAVGSLGCDPVRRETHVGPTPRPTPTAVEALTAQDVRVLVAVRARALQRAEERVTAIEASGPTSSRALPDLGEEEREAARALGVDHRRYVWAGDRAARVLAMQRQAEDRRLLVGELGRTQTDLLAQMSEATDPAAREFLEAQLRSIEAQIADLRAGQSVAPGVEAEVALLEAARVDLALLRSREEKLQDRLRALVRREGGSSRASSADGAGKTRGTPGSP